MTLAYFDDILGVWVIKATACGYGQMCAQMPGHPSVDEGGLWRMAYEATTRLLWRIEDALAA